MDIKTLEKRKAIIINEDNKILVFRNDNNIKFPTIKSKYEKVIPILGENYLQYYKYLAMFTNIFTRYEIVNGHSKKKETNLKEVYYLLFHSLTEEEITSLMQISEEKGMYPDFLSLEELRYFYEYRYYTKSTLAKQVEKRMQPIIMLEDKLGKRRILERCVTYVRN